MTSSRVQLDVVGVLHIKSAGAAAAFDVVAQGQEGLRVVADDPSAGGQHLWQTSKALASSGCFGSPIYQLP